MSDDEELNEHIKRLQQLVAVDHTPKPVTKGMYEWLDNGAKVTYAAAERIMELVPCDIDNRGEVIKNSGKGRFRPSSIHNECDRFLALSYFGAEQVPFDRRSYSYMSNGTWGHLRWQAAGLSQGFLTDVEYFISSKDFPIWGSMDGRKGSEYGFELKTTGSWPYRRVLEQGPSMSHLIQVNAYMLLSGLKKFSIVYENRDSMDFHEFVVEKDDVIVASLKDRLSGILKRVEKKELPGMHHECVDMSGPRFNECQFRSVCPWYSPA
jgi:hypothetical protein